MWKKWRAVGRCGGSTPPGVPWCDVDALLVERPILLLFVILAIILALYAVVVVFRLFIESSL